MDWAEVIERAKTVQLRLAELQRSSAEERRANNAACDDTQRQSDEEEQDIFNQNRLRISILLKVNPADISDKALNNLLYFVSDEQQLIRHWHAKPWENEGEEQYRGDCEHDMNLSYCEADSDEEPVDEEPQSAELWRIDSEFHHLIHDGETYWQLERNAAAAGFHRMRDYLTWRAEDLQPGGV